MATAGDLLDLDQFKCPICLDLLKDPVAIPCGHSYCMGCIKGYWDQDNHTGVYSCPQCRQTFTSRPVLGRNTILADMVEKLKKAGLQAAPPAHCYAGPGDVACDVCTGRKRKAVKSCLVCLASYCESDLILHEKLNGGKPPELMEGEERPRKRHKLIDATSHLEARICSRHDKLLEVFCRTDQQCICLQCMMDEHRGHDTVSAAAGRTEKQRQLGETKNMFQEEIQRREEEVCILRDVVDTLTRSAQAAVEDSERIFAELIRSIERRRSEVKELIRDQEKAAVREAEGLLEQLEQEIADLRRRDAELEQLSHTEDHIHFLQVSTPPEDPPIIAIDPHMSLAIMTDSVLQLKEQLGNICQREAEKTFQIVKVQGPDPKTRFDFLQYSCGLTLDMNTLNRTLRLSEGNRKVSWGPEHQSYPDHPDRFDHCAQVLCREGLTGRCYWEAEWSGIDVYMAVSYKGVSRKEEETSFLGFNEESWSLYGSEHHYYLHHDSVEIKISAPPSSRIGVYLDHSAGTLSFYSVSDTMTLLHRVQTTFTEPLYPGFGFSVLARDDSFVKLFLL